MRTGVWAEDGDIRLLFTYERVKWDYAKKVISGVRFDENLRVFRAPASSLSACIEWADQFNIPVHNALRMVAELQKSATNSKLRLSAALSAPPVEIPGLTGDLMDHQHAAVRYAAAAKRTFIADDVGVGKTLSAIATLEYLHSQGESVYPALVVCPPKLALNWKKEYSRWLPSRSVEVISTKKQPLGSPDVTIIGYSIIHARQAELAGFRSLICDESHAFKTMSAQRTKAAKKIARKIPEDGAVLNLTGTPITIRPAEYAPQLEILGRLDEFGGEMAFYRRFCDAKKDRYNKWDFSGSSNLEELNTRLRSMCYIRRERMDVIKDLPPAFPRDVLVELEPRWASEYAQAEADIVAYLVNRARVIAEELGLSVKHEMVKARMKAEAGKHLVEISVLRRLSGLGKIPSAVDWVQARIEEGRQVIVAAHHRDVVDAMAGEFGGLKIQGGQSGKEVETSKASFQSGAPVIVVSIQAGKEGHTLTAASDVLFIEFPWTSTDFDQMWGRAHRKGQTKEVWVTSMLGANTIDEGHFDMIGRRRIQVRAATSGAPVDAGESVLTSLLDRGLAAL